MAIAGVIIMTTKNDLEKVEQSLGQYQAVTNMHLEKETYKLAIVLDIPVLYLEETVEQIQSIQGVLNTSIAFVNYEYDMDQYGKIPCPPHKAKKHADHKK